LQPHLPFFILSSYHPLKLVHQARKSDVAKLAELAGDYYKLPAYTYPDNNYPFFRVPEKIISRPVSARPVFIVLMESFNALQLAQSEKVNGPSAATRLARRSLTVNSFYANGQDSLTGQLAVLCSQMPGIIKHTILGQNYACLPHLLRNAGYETLFFYDIAAAYSREANDSMKWLGFTECYARLKEYPAHQKPRYGWSMEGDAEYYRNVFEKLRERPNTSKPQLVVIANSENHFPYDQSEGMLELMLDRRRWPSLFRKSQDNAVKALDTFFVEMQKSAAYKDAIVVVVGDHSTPMLEHGNVMRDQGFYEENYLTFFAMQGVGKAHLEVQASQIDIAPTILAAVGLSVPNHFIGQSLLSEKRFNRPLFLTQYGDGGYYIIHKSPFKYAYRVSDGRSYLFNMSSDPEEKSPLSNADELLQDFAAMHSFFALNQAVILQNRQLPPGP
jgi:phosphoglycerol transferase MdoB-like AlkP superfamily enzyme